MKPPILIAILLFFASCDNDNYIEITDQCTFIDLFSSSCFVKPTDDKFDELIFKDSASYLSFVDSMRLTSSTINCDSATSPSIDFENYVLLGKYASGAGCDVSFKKRIYRDITNQKIIYEIDVKTSGLCDMLGYNNNWVLIPKPLFYEEVNFILNE